MLAIAEMYVLCVSTRKVKKITEELCGLEMSKSQVSVLAKSLDTNPRLELGYPSVLDPLRGKSKIVAYLDVPCLSGEGVGGITTY